MGSLSNAIGSLGVFSRLKTAFAPQSDDDAINLAYFLANAPALNTFEPVDVVAIPNLSAAVGIDYGISGNSPAQNYPVLLPSYSGLSKGAKVSFYNTSIFTTTFSRVSATPSGMERIMGITGAYTQHDGANAIGPDARGGVLEFEYSGDPTYGWLMKTTINF